MCDSTRDSADFDERRIDGAFAELNQCHLPGAAVGVAIAGKPVYMKGFGLANMELPVVLSPATRMRIMSMTKHFATLAYMLLCEEGRADIDDKIGVYLPELHRAARDVTLRQLMGNTSGLRDVFSISWQFSGEHCSASSSELLALYRDIDDVNAAPGTTWIYNNGGFLMLSVAIERVTGQPLEDVLRERIFEPAGMYATRLRRTDVDFVPGSASSHMTDTAGDYEKAFFGTAFAGEGGVVSTVEDMLRWMAQMDAPVVGNAATWATMKAPQQVANGTSTGYGLGLFAGEYRGKETLFHSGDALGCSSHMVKVPSAGLDVVVMANREDVVARLLAERVLDACLAGLRPSRTAPVRPLASGTFRSPVTGRVVQLFGMEGKQIASIDGLDMPVEFDDGGVLRPIGIFGDAKLELALLGDLENPSATRLRHFGNTDELLREKAPQATKVVAIAGRYRSEATGTEATVSEGPDGPRLTTVGRFGSAVYKLEPIGDGIWRARAQKLFWLNGILSFAGSRPEFLFYNYRTWALPFRRVG